MDVFISSIEGNRQKLDGGAMFGNAPRPMWEKWYKPDERGRIELACRAMLIKVGDRHILCETGIGAFFEPKLAERYGVQNPDTHMLLNSLHKLKLTENDIDAVILSHLHFDHAGGLMRTFAEAQSGQDSLLFPKAKYIVGETAWKRCQQPHLRDKASFIPELTQKLLQTQRLIVIPEGSKTTPVLPACISFFYTSGHTPGHMHTLVQGAQSTIVFCGDLIPGTAWLHVPLTMGYDRFPEQLIDEKQELYKKGIPGQWIFFYTHDPVYAASRCDWDEHKKVVPIETKPSLVNLKI
jgi:glyoxylase-like metal-dependent hydrolase (beta-lactamase superfamily II)